MPIRASPSQLLSSAVVSFGIAFRSEDRSSPPRVIPVE